MKRINIFLVMMFSMFILSACYAQEDQNKATGSSRSNPPSAEMKQEVDNVESQIIDALKAKDMDQFGKLLSDDFRGVYDDGIYSKDEEINRVKNYELRSLDKSDENVVFPADNVAIMTYKADRKSSANGQDVSGTYNVTTVLVKDNGQWKVVEHSMIKENKGQ